MKKTIQACIFIIIMFTCIFSCSRDSDITEYDLPTIKWINTNISTNINLPLELSFDIDFPEDGIIFYQWYERESKELDGKPIQGATKASYIPETKEIGEFYYYCIITSNYKNIEKTTVTPTIIYLVNPSIYATKPTILSQPQDYTGEFGDIYSLEVLITPTKNESTTYQWYYCSTKEGEFETIDNETDFKLTGQVNKYSLGYYYCRITNTIDDNGDGGIKSVYVDSDIAYLNNIDINVVKPEIIQTSPSIQVFSKDSVVLSVDLKEKIEGNISYEWYKTQNSADNEGVLIKNANRDFYIINSMPEKSIEYYYCVVTNTIDDNGDYGIKKLTATSKIFTVVNTGLPLISITTVDNEEPTCEYFSDPTRYWGATIINANKVPARLVMSQEGQVIYDSGEYEPKVSGLTVKIRGNTSAYGVKKPYKLKLQKKADLLKYTRTDNEEHSDKNWVLLKTGTSLNTEIGLRVADLMGFAWTPSYDYVDLSINGQYRGIYILIESVEKADYRINVKKKGYIIERDTYWYTENLFFETQDDYRAVVKYTFKYPDPDDEISENDDSFTYIKDYINRTYESTLDGTYNDYLDIDSFVKWILVHDILGTTDGAGSNIYISKYDNTSDTKIKMETPWDFDSIFLSSSGYSSIHNSAIFFYQALFTSDNKTFISSYKNVWNEKKDTLFSSIVDDLENISNDKIDSINVSRQIDSVLYNNNNYLSVETEINNAILWFNTQKTRLNAIIPDLE